MVRGGSGIGLGGAGGQDGRLRGEPRVSVKVLQCHVNGIAVQNLTNAKGYWSRWYSTKFAKSFIFSFSVVFSFHGHLVLIDLSCFKETIKVHTEILFSLEYGNIYSLNSL